MKALIASALLLPIVSVCAAPDTTINALDRYAYGANVGWLDWCTDAANGAVLGPSFCLGYLYAANCGWIHLGDGTPVNGMQYQNNNVADFGVNHDGAGNLTGYAYGANVGWISFGLGYPAGVATPRLDLVTGQISGYLYGANIGWISLDNGLGSTHFIVRTDRLAQDTDSDADGLSDPWELRNAGNLAQMGASTDNDGDGVSDLDECRAGTNPMDAADCLRIVEIRRDAAGEVGLTWTSQPTRLYRVWGCEGMDVDPDWVDCSPAEPIPADPGAATTYRFRDPIGRLHFFRIESVRPLAP